ncbi:MAG: tetratricopeptide repeat protein [Prevotella sp.]|nr:tetratricopeptide repeat protein [Prevotella sp.]
MNKKLRATILLFVQLFTLTTLLAQPAPVKKAAQSVFTLTTFAADGSIIGSTHGVFVGQNGTAIAMWHPFDGAQRAVVIDAKGNSHEVDAMLGVSELYDICQFRIKNKAGLALPLATADQAATTVYLLDYDLKKPVSKKLTPQKTEKFMTTNNYYLFNDVDVSNTDLGCPIINEQGQLLGIMQRNKNGGQAYSADARLISTFSRNGLSLNDNSMRATGIRTALPDDEQQATLMLMIAGQQADSIRYDAYVNEFIEKFPTSTEGYRARASRYVTTGQLRQADNVYAQEVKKAAKKDEAYYDYAQAVYRAVSYRVDTTFTDWNYNRAMTLAQEAEKINALPIYRHLQAQIVYAQGDYQKALDMFTDLQKTDMGKNGEIYYEAAQCKTQLKAPASDIETLLTAAVNAQTGSVSAPYVLARGRFYDNAGEYRKAFKDYLAYDTLMNNRATHDFYYTKFKCEQKIRQYKLAINDIAHAIVLNRTEPTYYAEMAGLQLQLNQLQDAITTCNMGLQLTQEYADLYIILGIAQCELKDKQNMEEGIANLQKAQALGDERAAGLIAKYKK